MCLRSNLQLSNSTGVPAEVRIEGLHGAEQGYARLLRRRHLALLLPARRRALQAVAERLEWWWKCRARPIAARALALEPPGPHT